jgi:dUTP pyrophosphatase
MELKVKKVHNDAKLPEYAHPHDAGMDLFALSDTEISPGEFIAIGTGVSIEVPEGYAGLIWDKSGIAITNGLKILGGVIDSGYRGEVKVGIINLSKKNYKFEKGHKVAQMIIQEIKRANLIEVINLSKSSRGDQGFGSTGK